MRRSAPLIAVCAIGLPMPGTALAATGDIGCIEARLGAAAMQRIGDGVVAAADRGEDPSRALDFDREALLAARQACRTAHNWSPDAVQAAVSYAQARATLRGAESALKRDALDPTRLSAGYAALPVADRRSLIAKASPGAINAATAAGGTATARRHVLLYFAALAAIEFYPADFAAA